MFFLDLWRLQLQTLQWKSLFEVLSSEGNLAGRFMPPKPIKICAVCFRRVSAKGDLLTLLIISPPAERKYVSHYERLEIDCSPLADARRVWLAAVPGIIAEPDSSEEPVPHLAGPRQSVRPRRRPGLPSVSGRVGSLVLFGTAYANAAARTKSRQKVLEITVIRGVSLSFYGETPHLRRLQRLMMHLGATFSSPPGDPTSMQHPQCVSKHSDSLYSSLRAKTIAGLVRLLFFFQHQLASLFKSAHFRMIISEICSSTYKHACLLYQSGMSGSHETTATTTTMTTFSASQQPMFSKYLPTTKQRRINLRFLTSTTLLTAPCPEHKTSVLQLRLAWHVPVFFCAGWLQMPVN